METLAVIVAIAAVGIPAVRLLGRIEKKLAQLSCEAPKEIPDRIAEQPDEDGDSDAHLG